MRPEPGTGKLVPATTLDELRRDRWPGRTRRRSSSTTSSRVPSFDMHGRARALARAPGARARRADRRRHARHGHDGGDRLPDRPPAARRRAAGRADRRPARRRRARPRRAAQPPRRDPRRGVPGGRRTRCDDRASARRSTPRARCGRSTRAPCAPSPRRGTARSATSTAERVDLLAPARATAAAAGSGRARARRPDPPPRGQRRALPACGRRVGSACDRARGHRPRATRTSRSSRACARQSPPGVAVVVCSRCVEGRVEPVYGRGGGRDLAEAGAVFAGDLAGPKARVLLQLAGGDASVVAAEAG